MRSSFARFALPAITLGVLFSVAPACSSFESDPPGAGQGGADGGDVVAPPGCDPAKEPKDQPACVVDSFGLFVDATNGNDAALGTKSAPMKSISAAYAKLGGAKRIHVCEGVYPEHLRIERPIAVFGGFACAGWTYTGTKPRIEALDEGAAVTITTTSDVSLSDLELVAKPANVVGVSSIAVAVTGSDRIALERCNVVAGAGKAGVAGEAGSTGLYNGDPNGSPASGMQAGASKVCSCSSGGASTGGGGGPTQTGGTAGAPPRPPSGASDGAPGTGNLACNSGGTGHDGAPAPDEAFGAGAAALGVLDGERWRPAAGTIGTNGGAGQGGGGGGGRDASNAGGGGACGGCGGTGGKPGAGGGASVAILSSASTIRLHECTLVTGAGGAGGQGGVGGLGGAGGSIGGTGSCPGGEGGKGGNGGAGGGGAGGVSVGVLYKGTAPVLDATTSTLGPAGPGGVGGAAGMNDGIPGIAAETFAAP